MSFYSPSWRDQRHKVFVSYYHRDDQFYRNEFERRFGHLFISKSVQLGDIDSELSAEYIKRLIQDGYITDSSVVVVLIGPKTRCRKHVDWEISAGLNKKLEGYSGLLGILLPTFPITTSGQYYYENIPDRLADNLRTDYATIYTWNWICQYDFRVKEAIEEAYERRTSKSYLIDNSRLQLARNLCE